MANYRNSNAEPTINTIEEISTPEISKDDLKNFRRITVKRCYKIRNSINNGIWPSSFSDLRLFIASCFLLMIIESSFTSSINELLWTIVRLRYFPSGCSWTMQALIVSSVIGITVFTIVTILRQGFLKLLLGRRGWMYELSKSPTVRSTLCYWAVKVLSSDNQSLYSWQRSMPRLPVPAVKDTLDRLYESLEHICTSEEFQEIKRKGKEFENTSARKFQTILHIKSWFSQNYISDWWEYNYLMNRSSLVNSNYYTCGRLSWVPTDKPISRAASLIYNLCIFKRLIDREELKPAVFHNIVPVCMTQSERILATVRIPRENCDQIRHYPDSKHIIINVNGIYYKLEVYDSKNQLLVPTMLEEQLNWIVKDAELQTGSYSEVEKSIAALSSLQRNQWARIRKKHLSIGVNRMSLKAIEEAICCVTLTDFVPSNLSEKGKYLLHGDGKCLWFDKSFNLIIFGNAAAGWNAEHTVADGSATVQMWCFMLNKELLERMYDENGHCMPFRHSFKQARVKPPLRLVWEINPELHTCVEEAVFFSKTNNDDIDLEVLLNIDRFSKGAIKKLKISPDAFVQIALQLTYFKDSRKFVHTYEPASTRLYQGGRTEVIRCSTKEVKDFVMSMQQSEIDDGKKIFLLKKAASKHQKLVEDAMNGKGIDRHLFALHVAGKRFGYECDFLSNVVNQQWTISTSSGSYYQGSDCPDMNLQILSDKVFTSGGFVPICDDGYGIGYNFTTDRHTVFHVSSKHSCPQTDSKKFLQLLVENMEDMIRLFEEQ